MVCSEMDGEESIMSTERERLDKLLNIYPLTFRNDVGNGYVGGRKYSAKKTGAIPVQKGDLVIINPGRIAYGLAKGSGDLAGWSEIEVTPDMVGKILPVFTSIEDKSENDNISLDQIIFYLNVKLAGGIAQVYKEGVCMTHDEIMNMSRRKDDRKGMKEGIIRRLEGRLKG